MILKYYAICDASVLAHYYAPHTLITAIMKFGLCISIATNKMYMYSLGDWAQFIQTKKKTQKMFSVSDANLVLLIRHILFFFLRF